MPASDPRKVPASWMTAPENPYFASDRQLGLVVLWQGTTDPPDDMSRANPAVHPELLDALVRHFVATSLTRVVRALAVSESYGLSSAMVPGNERDTRLSHQLPMPLTRIRWLTRAGPGHRRRQSISNVAWRAIDLPDPMS